VVIWSLPAKSDLRSIHDFIGHDSRFYAKKVVHDIREKTNVLEQLPRAGRKVPEINDDTIRELSLYSYRIIYQIKGEQVFVLTVVHKRRDLQPADIPHATDE